MQCTRPKQSPTCSRQCRPEALHAACSFSQRREHRALASASASGTVVAMHQHAEQRGAVPAPAQGTGHVHVHLFFGAGVLIPGTDTGYCTYR